MALSDPLTAVAHRTQTLRILVIDDSDADRMAYRRMLGKVSDLEVQLTETGLGLDGVELALEGEFDCILLDYFLPDAEALECLERLTVASGRSGPLDPPVIVLTGEGNEQVAAEVMRSGASDYIPKAAISPASLGRSITNAVAKAGMRRDIARSQEELRVANADLRRRNREIETFYHSLSHELKTPLTGAREFASILLDGLGGSLSEVQTEYLGYVLSSCDRMQVYINDILDVARIDSGRPKLRPRWCEVDELMRSIIALVRPPAERAGVTITLETEAGLPQVYVDPDRISQVLSNLVNNAVKYSPEGERVRVKPGYARNFLIPRGLAALATKNNVKRIEHEKRVAAARAVKARAEAETLAKRLGTIRLTLNAKTGEDEKMYGSITSRDVEEALIESGFEIDRRKIVMEPIKALGDHKITVKIAAGIDAEISVEVLAKS